MDHKKRDPLPLDGDVALERFVALSPGIGLGEPRVKVAREEPRTKRLGTEAAKLEPPAAMPLAQCRGTGAARVPSNVASPKASREPVRLLRRLSAYSFDFILVFSTLSTGLMCAAVWQSADKGIDLASEWSGLDMVQWLSRFEVYEVVLSVYAVFLAYVILFKAIAGFTLGESILSLGRKARKPQGS